MVRIAYTLIAYAQTKSLILTPMRTNYELKLKLFTYRLCLRAPNALPASCALCIYVCLFVSFVNNLCFVQSHFTLYYVYIFVISVKEEIKSIYIYDDYYQTSRAASNDTRACAQRRLGLTSTSTQSDQMRVSALNMEL